MQGLSQWAALTLLAETTDLEFADLLGTPASWYVDAGGVAHGKIEHVTTPIDPDPVPVHGTLGDLVTASRHTKSCCSVALVAGPPGVDAAVLAQKVTEFLREYANLDDTLARAPHEAVRAASRTLTSLTEDDGPDPVSRALVQSVRARAARVLDEALAVCRSETNRADLVANASVVSQSLLPESPVAQVRALLHAGSDAWLARILTQTPLEGEWVTRANEDIDRSNLANVTALDLFTRDQVAGILAAMPVGEATGTALREALTTSWKDRMRSLVRAAPDWAAEHAARARANAREALVIGSEAAWRRHDREHAAWSRAVGDHAVVVPHPVAEMLSCSPAALPYAVLDRPLTGLELDTIQVLARDAQGVVADVAELIKVACAIGD